MRRSAPPETWCLIDCVSKGLYDGLSRKSNALLVPAVEMLNSITYSRFLSTARPERNYRAICLFLFASSRAEYVRVQYLKETQHR